MSTTRRTALERAFERAALEHALWMAQVGTEPSTLVRRFTEDILDAGGCSEAVGDLEDAWEGEWEGFVAWLEEACSRIARQALELLEQARSSGARSDRDTVEEAFDSLAARGILGHVFVQDPAADQPVDAPCAFFSLEAQRPRRLREAASRGAERGFAWVDPDSLGWVRHDGMAVVRYGAVREGDEDWVRQELLQALRLRGLTVEEMQGALRLKDLHWMLELPHAE